MKFKGKEHESRYRHFCEKYNVKPTDRDANLLLFVLAAVVDENLIDDLVEISSWGLSIKPSGLYGGWTTGGSSRMVRLAFNLFTYGMPTVNDKDPVDAQMREAGRYTPVDLLSGLDEGNAKVALEAMRAFCFWGRE